jgi:hypothetical protein
MLKAKYLKQIKNKISRFSYGKKMKIFIYGSSLVKDQFGDIDIGIIGRINNKDIDELKADFEGSIFPYKVDIVDFNKVSAKFKNNVLKDKILWLKH